jgi:site-specific recombinase XerC
MKNMKTSRIGLLSCLEVNHVRHLLAHAVTPETAPHAVARVFAGLRETEARALAWHDMLLDSEFHRIAGIRVNNGRGFHRYVPAGCALQEWLAPFLGMRGRVSRHSNVGRQFREQARRHGLRLGYNILRCSYATHRYNQTRDLAFVANEMGVGTVLWRKLLWLPRRFDDAELFFQLTPEACGRPHWAQEVAAWREGVHCLS